MRKFILAAAMTTALVTGIVTQHASAVDSGDWVADNSCPVAVGTKANRVCFYRTRTAGINVNANVSTRDSAHSDNFYSTRNVINNAANDVTNGFSSTISTPSRICLQGSELRRRQAQAATETPPLAACN